MAINPDAADVVMQAQAGARSLGTAGARLEPRASDSGLGCIAGALTEAEFRAAISDTSLIHVEIRPTHRVHEHAGSAVVRASTP